MADNQKKIIPINYTNREFETIRNDLLQIAERLYPDSFQDFSEASFASLMIDAVSYVGDQLSFYLDYNVNESFLDTASQYRNVLRLGKVLGYKYPGRASTYGEVALFVLLPASSTGIGPDMRYAPILRRGSTVTSQNGLAFILTENVNFADPRHPKVVARVNDATGAPTFYAIKAYGNVVSGILSTTRIRIGPYERFKKVILNNPDISEITRIVDTEGNEYFEVDYLSQDLIYKEIVNKNFNNDRIPSILKPTLVSRKFVIERDRNYTYIQFGSGKAGDESVVKNPQKTAVDLFGKEYISYTTFDPTKLSKNENFGIVPENTTLLISYRATNPTNSNVPSGGIKKVSSALFDFDNPQRLSVSTVATIRQSLEVTNETPIIGAVSNPTVDDIKRRVYDTFPTQNRAVTQADYESLVYTMPAKFGSIKRCSVQTDPNSMKRNLNLYVVSEGTDGKLELSNQVLKNNIKTWLNNHRMINDTIDILDPYIINLGINFSIKTSPSASKHSVLQQAINRLASLYVDTFYIGEPLRISDIYQILKSATGVLDVISVSIVNMTGANYAGNTIEINKNLSGDGSMLTSPSNAVFEIKYPKVDIKGVVR